MVPFQKIGQFLTGSPADKTATEYAGRLGQLSGSRRLLFVSAAKNDQGATLDQDQLRADINSAIPAELHEHVELRVFDKNALAEMLRAARDEEFDLIVRGRRLPSHQLGNPMASTRLERKAPCSVLIVPGPARVHLSRLLVPIDFSEHSMMALETALQLARAGGAACHERPQVIVETTFAVHYGYQKTGVTLAEAAANIENAIGRKLDEFLAGVDTTGVDFSTVLMCSEQTAQSINEIAAARKMDMILVGSRGATPSAAAILGETAEYIIGFAAIPTLVVKKKGETVGLLNALLSGL